MRVITLFLLSLIFCFFNWVCTGLMVDKVQYTNALLFFINSIPWTVLLVHIAYAGHKYASKK